MTMNQSIVNEITRGVVDFINEDGKAIFVRRLRTCNATVLETEHFFVLQSYRTYVAAIDKETNTLYDFLRYVYGYTATSAQHIAKFAHDYGAIRRYTYRP